MTLYYKRKWDETSGEELTDSWGTPTYYFETDEQLNVVRQIQIFKTGQVLKYSDDFPMDKFGMIADQPLDENEFREFIITESTFAEVWENLERKTT